MGAFVVVFLGDGGQDCGDYDAKFYARVGLLVHDFPCSGGKYRRRIPFQDSIKHYVLFSDFSYSFYS